MLVQSMVLLLAFIIFLAVLVSIYLVRVSLKPRKIAYKKSMEKEVEAGWFTHEYFDELRKVEEYLDSPFGYRIHGFWLPNKGAKKSIILSHGFAYTLFGSLKYVKVFRKLGYNIFIYDFRYHGLSGGKSTSFGIKEVEDLKVIVSYVKKQAGKDSIVGTHGESFGGAVSLQHAAVDDRIDFVISDSSYASILHEFKHRIKVEYKLPIFPIIYISSFFNKLLLGKFYSQISPVQASSKIKVPTMIIHGEKDNYTPYEQGVLLYNALNGPKYMYSAKDAGHSGALGIDKKQYYLEVKSFLNNNNII